MHTVPSQPEYELSLQYSEAGKLESVSILAIMVNKVGFISVWTAILK